MMLLVKPAPMHMSIIASKCCRLMEKFSLRIMGIRVEIGNLTKFARIIISPIEFMVWASGGSLYLNTLTAMYAGARIPRLVPISEKPYFISRESVFFIENW